MSDLFPPPATHAPLAERMRPRALYEVIGQRHLIGPGKPLRLAFESGTPHSMILWGPPGVGKTTLARLMADSFDAEFVALSAVFSGVKDIREAMQHAQAMAQQERRTILFVDEVHRFNKAQQDAFLPYVESGTITFIGATTENPSFEVNSALLSRAAVYVLKSLDTNELGELFVRASRVALPDIDFEPDAKARLLGYADGDARRLLNVIETVQTAAQASGDALAIVNQRRVISTNWLNTTLAADLRRFDKGGDAFYDQISALHKSVRGSHPDAALYWLVRMLDGGADPLYLARRIVRMAIEDVGLADPRGWEVALNAAATYERLGSPEGELALANAVLYLAVAPKSNAAYVAYNSARAFVAKDSSQAVPEQLRNAPTKLMKDLGYGADYRYAHDESDGYAAGERYLPDGMAEPNWYQPTTRGLEQKIADKLAHLRQLDAKATTKK
ncbi:MAG: replication-associated recombination protein A [Rhodocyclaceae bacterium]|nr:replication-associated recombination protein A [Rhodocyclaceae bacterium]